jgi:hypothetical protein
MRGSASGTARDSTAWFDAAGWPAALGLFEADRFVIKLHDLWTIEAPEALFAVLHASG